MHQYTDRQRVIISLTILIIAIGGGYLYGGEKMAISLLKFTAGIIVIVLGQTLLIKFKILPDNSEKIKEEEIKRKVFNTKLKKNKVLLTWFISVFVGFFASMVIPFLILASPQKFNPSIWALHNDVIESNYWVLASIFYPYSIIVFTIGKNILKNEKGNRYVFYGASIFCWALFTAYSIFTPDQANIIFVMFALCMAITWLQLSLSKVFYHASHTKLDL